MADSHPPEPLAPQTRWFSERHVQISLPTPGDVARFFRTLASNPPQGLVDLVPGAASLLLEFDPVAAADDSLPARLRDLLAACASLPDKAPAGAVAIPFCAEADFAPDLEGLARERALDPAAWLEEFCAATFTVDFLGFMPGFAYLGGLPARLAAPRLDQPRPRVPAGSVAIAADRAGIYPFASPGGWRLVGRTPLALFDPAREPPALLAPGMTVRFALVSRSTFDSLGPVAP